MQFGSANTQFTVSPTGVVFEESYRRPRIFKITGGTNPYAATEQTMLGSTLADDPAGYTFPAASNLLYELNGVEDVASGTYVIGQPNPTGAGWIFASNGSSGGIRTQNEDGTDVEDPTNMIIADEDTGITFDTTLLSSGLNKLVMLAASPTQMGVVTTTEQTFVGQKAFSLADSTARIVTFFNTIGSTGIDIFRGQTSPFNRNVTQIGTLQMINTADSVNSNYRRYIIAHGVMTVFELQTGENNLGVSQYNGAFAVMRGVWNGSAFEPSKLHGGIDDTFVDANGNTFQIYGGIITNKTPPPPVPPVPPASPPPPL